MTLDYCWSKITETILKASYTQKCSSFLSFQEYIMGMEYIKVLRHYEFLLSLAYPAFWCGGVPTTVCISGRAFLTLSGGIIWSFWEEQRILQNNTHCREPGSFGRICFRYLISFLENASSVHWTQIPVIGSLENPDPKYQTSVKQRWRWRN